MHSLLLAAYAAWWRLFVAAELATRHRPLGSVLDFGAAAGELHHLLPANIDYDFVEHDDSLALALTAEFPNSRRQLAESLPTEYYSTVFALDSLEHNNNPANIIAQIERSLAPKGEFVLSGPTENLLYRLGRRIAGFSGHYHETNIHHIEKAAAEKLTLAYRTRGPAFLPLFAVSIWRKS